MSEPEAKQVIRFGTFEVDPRIGELRKNGLQIRLQDQPLHILLALLVRPGEVVTREELRAKLWPADTFVDFEHGLNAAVKRLRDALGDTAENPRFVETLPRRGYRFIASANSQSEPTMVLVQGLRSRWAVVTSLVSIAALATASYFYFHRAPKLTDKDTIVLADFTNTTGDPVFDGALRQGLSVQLEQSPFLSIVSDQQVQQTLQMMGQKPDAKLTPEIARELCQRAASAAVLDGSIAQIGTQYLLTLKAVNCASGKSLASTEAQASDKNHVLDALGKTASEIRKKLGESLTTVQKFDTPLEQATTSSLEALQVYSLGWKTMVQDNDNAAAVPLFQRAIQLDPNFAMAYASLGTSYSGMREDTLGSENTKKAYELRERVSEREKLYIESTYYQSVTGDVERARQVFELWAQVYPRDFVPHSKLANIYGFFGQHDKALEQARESHRLNECAASYAMLARRYTILNRQEEARATIREAQAKKLDSNELHIRLFLIAFYQNDAAGMTQQVNWAAGKPAGMEEWMMVYEANTAAYSGQLRKAREFSRRSIASNEWMKRKEGPALTESGQAYFEGLFGNAVEARQRAQAALALLTDRDVQSRFVAGLALALAGDVARAQASADDLAKRFPENTEVRFDDVPLIEAQIALDRNDSTRVIEVLRAAAPYELGMDGLYAAYLRGEAYLAAHQGSEAAAEFQKILDHPGIMWADPIGALAHLQIGRAYAMKGDTAKAKAAYQDFLTLWKDADPDIPILIAAKAEYAKLQ